MTTKLQPFPPTAVPCPPWCTEPTGHGYDQSNGGGYLVREHRRSLGDRNSSAAEVFHFAEWDGATEQPVEQPRISLWLNDDTIDENIKDPTIARQLAAQLMDAADALEAIQERAK